LSSNTDVSEKGNNSHYKRTVDKDASFLVSVKNISSKSTYQTNDACESYNNFHNSLKVAIDKSFPLSSNIDTVRPLFLRWWMRWCEVVEFEVVDFEVVEFEVVGVHHLIYN
jgi:hypothetical protein